MRIGLQLGLSLERTADCGPPVGHARASLAADVHEHRSGHTHQIAVAYGISNNNLTNSDLVG